MASLENVKYIDANAKDLVNGYLKQINQNSHDNHSLHSNIPPLIYCWCLLYYFINESFDLENSHNNYQIQNDDSIIRKRRDGRTGCAYLTNIVKSGIHSWKFKINAHYRYSITFGVWKMMNERDNSRLVQNTIPGQSYAWIANVAKKSIGQGNWDPYGSTIIQGDIVEMILDLKDFTLRYRRNDEDFGIAFQNPEKTEYTAVVSAYGEGTIIELISYTMSY